jgi:integrase
MNHSCLSSYITGFVEQKRALGFPYIDSGRIAANFECFCAEQFPNEITITEEMGLRWATVHDGEGKKGLSTRVGVVRELARYMIREGIDAYVISSDYGRNPRKRYIPHIFTDSELCRIFEATDRLVPSKRDPSCHLVAPVLFRLLYSCGLRPSEGRLLKRENINLQSGVIKIPESKGHKDRIIVMTDDMLTLCQHYHNIMENMKPDSEYFFPSNRKRPTFDHHWVSMTLERCWKNAGIGEYSGNKPRPYDFRHTYASKTLYRWMKEGRDLDNCLPYLSAYMGHAHFEHTAYYIHLVPEFFKQMSQMDLGRFASLLPEVEQ